MLPKDVLSLINSYNEDGVYLEYKSRIWWFNGDKIKEWCLSYNCSLTDCCELFERKYLKEDRKCVENTGAIYDYTQYGAYLCVVGSFVYNFSSLSYGINEKYDINKQEWSIIGSNLIGVNEIFLLRNMIYMLSEDNRIFIFDVESNIWQDKCDFSREIHIYFSKKEKLM